MTITPHAHDHADQQPEDALTHDEQHPDADEDDFMSDAVLARVLRTAAATSSTQHPQSYSEKRRRQQREREAAEARVRGAAQQVGRAERERAARREALGRNLIDLVLGRAAQDAVAAAASSNPSGSSTAMNGPREAEDAAGPRRPGQRQEADDEGEARGKPRPRTDAPGSSSSPSPASLSGARTTGPTAAVRMMLAMGYEHGKTLGTSTDARPSSGSQNRGDDDDDHDTRSRASPDVGDRKAEDASLSATRTTEPVRADERWLGGGGDQPRSGTTAFRPSRGPARHGLGSAAAAAAALLPPPPPTSTSAREADPNLTPDPSLSLFRTRRAHEERIRHAEALLRGARRTCEQLDRERAGIQYSVLWLDPAWLQPGARLTDEELDLLGRAFPDVIDTASDGEGGSSDVDEGDLEERRARRTETMHFCSLDAVARLARTASHLRESYHYCLFCGCAYDSAEELRAQCPGEDEDDH